MQFFEVDEDPKLAVVCVPEPSADSLPLATNRLALRRPSNGNLADNLADTPEVRQLRLQVSSGRRKHPSGFLACSYS